MPKNKTVSQFLDELNHPLRKEIEQLRICILSADNRLSENIKWNGPNYCLDNEDRITMRIQPLTTKQVQIIFHRGAKKQEPPKDKLIEDKSGLLMWKENDRAITTFENMAEVESRNVDLANIVTEWIKATK